MSENVDLEEIVYDLEGPIDEVVPESEKLDEDVTSIHLNFTQNLGKIIEDVTSSEDVEDVLEIQDVVEDPSTIDPNNPPTLDDSLYPAFVEMQRRLDQEAEARGESLKEVSDARGEVIQAMVEVQEAQETATQAGAEAEQAKEDALAAHEAAMGAADIANSKSKIYRESTDPISGEYKKGDQWWKYEGSLAKALWIYDGTSWVSQILDNSMLDALSVNKLVVTEGANISSAVIGNLFAQQAFMDNILAKKIIVQDGPNTVGTTLIENGAITTDKVAANAINAAKINVGDLAANDAFFYKARANQLTVSSDNLLPDPLFNRPECWSNSQWITEGAGMNGGKGFVVPATTTQAGVYTWTGGNNPEVTAYVNPGEILSLSVWYKCTAETLPNMVSLYQRFYDKDGNMLAPGENVTYYGGSPGGPADTWLKIRGSRSPVPDNAKYMAFGMFAQSSLNAQVTFSDPIVKESAGTLLVGNPDSTHIEIANNIFSINREDEDGQVKASLELGGETDDEMILRSSSGLVTHGLYKSGNSYASGNVYASNVIIGGDSVIDLIDERPRGIMLNWKQAAAWDNFGSNELGIVVLTDDVIKGRMYRIHFDCMLTGPSGNLVDLKVRFRDTGSGSPLVTSLIAGGNRFILNAAGRHCSMDVVWEADWSARCGFLITGKNATGNNAVTPWGSSDLPMQAWLEDCGPASGTGSMFWSRGGGSPHTPAPTPPPDPVKTYTGNYGPYWYASWRGGSKVTDYLHHGYYGGYQRYSMVGFGGSLASDLSGASIVKAEVYLQNESWWGSTGTARIGVATNTSEPGSPVTSGNIVQSSGWAQGAGRWVDITSIFNTSTRAITLGAGAGTSTTNYGKFVRGGAKLRVTYRK